MTDINMISPYIRVALDSIILPPWALHERVIFDYELLYIKEGDALLTIEDEVYEGSSGDVFLFKPGKRHSILMKNNTVLRQPHIHFDFFYREDSPEVKVSFKAMDKMSPEEMAYFREDVTKEGVLALPDKLVVGNPEYFENMLFEIINEVEAKAPFYEILVKGLLIRLLAYLLKENDFAVNPVASSHRDELKQVREFLKNNLNRELTLDELEKEFKISKYHLSRLFKKAFGITPIHYSRMLKMEKARELIQFSNMNISSVAETLGFNSINAFSRAFRNLEGVPPTYYKRS